MKKSLFLAVVLFVMAGICPAEEPQSAGNTINAATDIGSVVVTAGIYPESEGIYSGTADIINAEEIGIYGFNSISDVLDTVPGSYIKRSGGLQGMQTMVIRGALPRQSKVMIDGVATGEDIVSGGTDLSLLDITGVERVEVLEGDNSPLFGGNASGGAVNIITKKKDGRFFTQDVSYGTFDTKKFASALNFSLQDAAISLSGIDERSAGYETNSDYAKNTLKGSADYRSGVYESIVSAYYVKREMGVPGSLSYKTPTDRELDEVFNAALDGKIKLDFMDVKIAGALNKARLDYYGTNMKNEYTASVSFNSKKDNTFSLDGGYEAGVRDIRGAYVGTHLITNHAISGIAGASLFDKALDLSASGRLDFNSVYKTVASGGINASCEFSKEIKTHAGVNTGFSEPTIAQLYWPENPYSKPNPGLLPENSISYEAGADYASAPVKAGVVSYFRDVKNLIANDYSGGKGMPVNINSAYIFGVEASADYTFAEIAGIGMNYAFLHGIDRGTNGRLAEMPEHKITGRVFVKVLEKLSLSASCEYTGDRIDGFSHVLIAGYFLANARASYEINKNFSVSVDVENILDNKKYQVVADYPMPGRAVTASLNAGF